MGKWNQRLAATVRRWGPGRSDAESRYVATPFTKLTSYEYIKRTEKLGQTLSIDNPFFRANDGRRGSMAVIEGKEYINFAWCNYLGLNEHPAVAQAAKSAVDQYGTCISASRMVAGEVNTHRELEAEIADFLGVEDALVFVSGHAANVSTIGTMVGDGDIVLHDELVHNSAVVGTRLSGAASQSFPHNNLDACENMLRNCRANYRNALIVVEGLYSTEGDIPDLARLIEIKERYGAWLMVDDAHGVGVLGASGRGCAEHSGVDPRRVDIWMGTLSKTLASCGGYIAGEKALIEILKYMAPGFVYSVGLPAPMAAAALAALRVLRAEPDRVERVRANGTAFLREAREAALDTANSRGLGMVPVMIGSTIKLAQLTQRLFARGINASPIISPGVPVNTARLRFFVTSEHTHEEIRAAVSATREELRKGLGLMPNIKIFRSR
jgi:8-amino-7-oxononanoate synthase